MRTRQRGAPGGPQPSPRRPALLPADNATVEGASWQGLPTPGANWKTFTTGAAQAPALVLKSARSLSGVRGEATAEPRPGLTFALFEFTLRNGTCGAACTTVFTSTTPTATFAGLRPNTVYNVTVRGQGSSGTWTVGSGWATFRTPDTSALNRSPPPPQAQTVPGPPPPQTGQMVVSAHSNGPQSAEVVVTQPPGSNYVRVSRRRRGCGLACGLNDACDGGPRPWLHTGSSAAPGQPFRLPHLAPPPAAVQVHGAAAGRRPQRDGDCRQHGRRHDRSDRRVGARHLGEQRALERAWVHAPPPARLLPLQ